MKTNNKMSSVDILIANLICESILKIDLEEFYKYGKR